METIKFILEDHSNKTSRMACLTSTLTGECLRLRGSPVDDIIHGIKLAFPGIRTHQIYIGQKAKGNRLDRRDFVQVYPHELESFLRVEFYKDLNN